jgi:hypothetical protein
MQHSSITVCTNRKVIEGCVVQWSGTIGIWAGVVRFSIKQHTDNSRMTYNSSRNCSNNGGSVWGDYTTDYVVGTSYMQLCKHSTFDNYKHTSEKNVWKLTQYGSPMQWSAEHIIQSIHVATFNWQLQAKHKNLQYRPERIAMHNWHTAPLKLRGKNNSCIINSHSSYNSIFISFPEPVPHRW